LSPAGQPRPLLRPSRPCNYQRKRRVGHLETLRRFALELGFDTFVFWPEDEPLAQLERFAEEVVPALRR
jgi:hypothetical protein